MNETKKYLGVKLIQAIPMTAEEAHVRGHKISPMSKLGDPGYEVFYEDGYNSWSPKEVFDKAYRPTDGLTFGLAIEALKQGKRVCRTGWNGKGMWLTYIDGYGFTAKHDDVRSETLKYLPWIGMKTADECFVPWLASQTDILAEDWMIVE